MQKMFVICIMMSAIIFVGNSTALFAQLQNISSAEELTNKGIQAYQSGNPGDCLLYLNKVIELYPDDYAGWLNFGSFNYQIALDLKRQNIDNDTVIKLSVAAMNAFSKTIILGRKLNTNDPNVSKPIGQAAFLLGDLWHYIYDKPQLARDYFELAKKYWPENPNLLREMEVVSKKIPADYVPQPLKDYEVNLVTGEMTTNNK